MHVNTRTLAAGCAALLLLLGLAWTGIAARNGSGGPPDLPQSLPIGKPVPHFQARALVMNGSEAHWTDQDSSRWKQPTVILFLGTRCGATQRSIQRVRALETEYAGADLNWVYVYPNVTESRSEKVKFHRRTRLRGAMIEDKDATIARKLGGRNTAEALLVSGDGTLVYRGGIDDGAKMEEKVKRRHLKVAIDQLRAGKTIDRTTTRVRA